MTRFVLSTLYRPLFPIFRQTEIQYTYLELFVCNGCGAARQTSDTQQYG